MQCEWKEKGDINISERGIVCEAQNLLAKKNLSFKKKTFPPQVLQEKVLAMDTHFSKLPNSLIEICVVVGMDQDTGLVAARSAEVI